MNIKQAKDYIKRLRKIIKKLRAEVPSKLVKKSGGAPSGAEKK